MPNTPTPPAELRKFNRLFELIELLSSTPYYTAGELATRLGVSKKTVYNYLKLLDSVGFQTDTTAQHRHYLHLERPDSQRDVLTQAEAEYLQNILWVQGDGDPLRNELLLKLNQQFSLVPILQNRTQYTSPAHRKGLQQAMENGLRVVLRNYTDGRGRTADRTVEPIDFLDDYTYLYAHDVEKSADRRYRLSRIGLVELTDQAITGDHGLVRPDPFGWTGRDRYALRLGLSPRAAQLLHEENPKARPYILRHRGEDYLDVVVHGFEPVARFCMGLGPLEITIETYGDGEALRAFIRGRWGEGF